MRSFRNILYVSHGTGKETESLKQALSLARNNKAALSVLIVSPDLPVNMKDYVEQYETSLRRQLQDAFDATATAIGLEEPITPDDITIQRGSAAATQITRHVLRHEHDLVVKEAETRKSGIGFKALDMDLLRQCPCPVWLCRPISRHRHEIEVGVAIDPHSEREEAQDLTLRLLEVGRSLADTCSGTLHILSCWSFGFEEFLRDSAWVRTDEETLNRALNEAQTEHRRGLDAMIERSGIGGKLKVHHAKGEAEDVIPDLIDDLGIDILTMGTVARTGIPGFLIGNTAENVVQKIGCSLLALKPYGFVSPVKAY